MLGLKPCTEAGVMNLGLVFPEARRECALNMEMAEFDVDGGDLGREETADVCGTDEKPCGTKAFAERFYEHG